MNETVCYEKYPSMNDSWCPAVWDDWLCWPSIPPGSHFTQNCPRVEGTLINAKAYRKCMDNGTWEYYDEINRPKGFSHYDDCFTARLRELLQMCLEIEQEQCNQISRVTRILELVGLSFSLISLIISLWIFFSYRVLKNNRTKIHKNLFIATLLQVLVRLILYGIQALPSEHKMMPYLNETVIILLEYTKTAMFMWMFIEGLYLHNMITVTVFQEYTYIKLYFYTGWILPAIMTSIWVTMMVLVKSSWAYYYFLPYYWILEGPRSIMILVNLLFLINIIRILIKKLRESQMRELEQVRKAVRAAIFLLPLMGIANIFFWVDYHFTEAWKLALWMYTSYFLNTFQGFFVAILYCFLNGEVQAAIKNSWYLQISLRNHDYAPCRNSTFVSTMADAETIRPVENSETKKPILLQAHYFMTSTKWIQNCFKPIDGLEQAKDNSGENSVRNAVTLAETTSNQIYPGQSNNATDSSILEDECSE